MLKAFWISSSGNGYEVPQTHIKFVLNNPELFEVDLNQYKKLLNKHNEPWGSEGQARREFLKEVIKKEWVRGRFRPRRYFYVLEMWEFSMDIVTNTIHSWISDTYQKGKLYKGVDLKFQEVKTHETWKIDIEQFIHTGDYL